MGRSPKPFPSVPTAPVVGVGGRPSDAYGTFFNNLVEVLKSKNLQPGTFAARPAAALTWPGTVYYASDTGQTFISTGTTWVPFSPAPGQGVPGPPGEDGVDGEPGTPGPVGLTGSTGATGPTGLQGVLGAAGSDGEDGEIGPMGPTGATGATGSTGSTGATGPAGAVGNWYPGDEGDAGLDGIPGPVGPTGATGATGAGGPVGPTVVYDEPLYEEAIVPMLTSVTGLRGQLADTQPENANPTLPVGIPANYSLVIACKYAPQGKVCLGAGAVLRIL